MISHSSNVPTNTVFHYFRGWVAFHCVYVCFIYPSFGGSWVDFFFILTIVNSVKTNTEVQLSLRDIDCPYPSSGTAGL